MDYFDKTNMILFTCLTIVTGLYLQEPGIIGGEHYGIFMGILALSISGVVSTFIQFLFHIRQIDTKEDKQ